MKKKKISKILFIKLYTEKKGMVLQKKGESNNNNNDIKRLVNAKDNNYNKIYFNINNKGKIAKTIKLKNSNFVLYIDIISNLKFNLIEKSPTIITNKSNREFYLSNNINNFH